MEERCTCGALLPSDARFCHKCGKPQYEADIQRMAAMEAELAPAPTVVAQPPVINADHIGVGNLRAVGITMLAAALALIGLLLVGFILPAAVPLILSAAGFMATRSYSRKQGISALSGALLGTMTGMWLFLVGVVCTFTARLLPQELMTNGLTPQMAQMYKLLQDPHQVFLILLVNFCTLVLSSTFGGLLAARLGRPQR